MSENSNIDSAIHAIKTGDAVGFKSAITAEIHTRAAQQISDKKMEVAASLFDDSPEDLEVEGDNEDV